MAAAYYDAIYGRKLYEYEAQCVNNLAYRYLRAPGRRLLDVACGTGRHIEHLKRCFQAEGLDASEEMLAEARRRNPDIVFHCMDMTQFHFDRRFDVITCLFCSIGYVKTFENLCRTLRCMASHLTPGGIVLIEPWYTPDSWKPGTVHSIFVDQPELKVARVSRCSGTRPLSMVDVHYLIGTPERIEHRSEYEELGLFQAAEMSSAMEKAGLEAAFEAEGLGLAERGVYIGRRSSEARV